MRLCTALQPPALAPIGWSARQVSRGDIFPDTGGNWRARIGDLKAMPLTQPESGHLHPGYSEPSPSRRSALLCDGFALLMLGLRSFTRMGTPPPSHHGKRTDWHFPSLPHQRGPLSIDIGPSLLAKPARCSRRGAPLYGSSSLKTSRAFWQTHLLLRAFLGAGATKAPLIQTGINCTPYPSHAWGTSPQTTKRRSQRTSQERRALAKMYERWHEP